MIIEKRRNGIIAVPLNFIENYLLSYQVQYLSYREIVYRLLIYIFLHQEKYLIENGRIKKF